MSQTCELPSSPLRLPTISKENITTSTLEKVFELIFENFCAFRVTTYQSAIIIPKKKVQPNALNQFTSELHKLMPALNNISSAELEKILEKSSNDDND